MKPHSRKAVFLDRDGTLIEDVGVLKNPDQVRLLPGVPEALRRLQDQYLFVGVTNQNGLARGELTLRDVDAVHSRLAALLEVYSIRIEKWYVCPHERRDGCDCIKPNPTFLIRAAAEFGIALEDSFIIGDHPHDVLTGDTVGTVGLYVLTGHGERHLSALPKGRLVFRGLLDAARWIEAHPRSRNDATLKIEGELKSRGGVP